MAYVYFDYTTKRDVLYNEVYMGYFIDSKNLFETQEPSYRSKVVKWDYIDKIYVISLEHRDDRRQKLHENLINMGIPKVTYFIPVKYPTLSLQEKKKLNNIFYVNLNSEPRNPTVMACFISHLICYKDAYKNVQKNCMILEDDCVIRDIPDDMYKTIEKFLVTENYSALYMHHNQLPASFNFARLLRRGYINHFDFKRLEIEKNYPGLRVFLGVGLTHCMIFSKEYLKILNDMKVPYSRGLGKNIDYILHRQAFEHDFYTTQVQYTTQMLGFSDITGVTTKKGFS
jgi:GR25 family glycosyltransferase involved in LPS biosynthesis